MPEAPTVVVNSSGLRSLVATAVALSDTSARDVVLLHVRDGRQTSAIRAEHCMRQAEHFQITRTVEIELPHIESDLYVPADQDGGASPLALPQTMLVALGRAIRLKARRLIWPAQFNGDFATIGRATEQVVLIEHLAQLEQQQTPAIEMPLLELTDQQLIELGTQLGVPWELAWTCMLAQDRPCMTCQPCRHRHAAFESAGIADPIEQPVKR